MELILEESRGELIAQGRDCFKNIYVRIQQIYKTGETTKNLQFALKKYNVIYNEFQADLGHYFRNIYHILKFINSSEELDEGEKYFYSSLLRALLSSYELVLTFYNGLSKQGNKKFKPLLEKYTMLKNINDQLLLDKEHKDNYTKKAFSKEITT